MKPPEIPISQPRSAPFFLRKRAFGVVPNDREFLAEHYVWLKTSHPIFLISPKKFDKSHRWGSWN
jgi:hypothetical protein